VRAAGVRFSGSLKKPVGDEVRLRALHWDGPAPVRGDRLRTSTGRQYLIERISTPRKAMVTAKATDPFTLVCRVLPDGYAADTGLTFDWLWTRKALRRPRGWRVQRSATGERR